MASRWIRTVGALAVLAFIAGCGNAGEQVTIAECTADREVTVFAASSLAKPLTAIAGEFEKANFGCVDVRLNFGASNVLAEQIVAGAPVDLFISASTSSMDKAREQIAVSSVYLRNRVVLAFDSKNSHIEIAKGSTVAEILNDPSREWIMCALEVPCGTAGQKALDSEGVKTKPISLEPDVKSVVAKLTVGEIEFAIVYHSDVVANPGLVEISFKDSQSATTDYMLGFAKTGNTAGEALMSYLYLDFAQRTLREAGFDTDMSK